MADRGDTHYLTSSLNKWFLFSSFVLLAATVWMMLEDWNAPWKKYQREIRRVEIEKTDAELARLEDAKTKQGEAELKAAVERAQAELAGKQHALEEAKTELFTLKGELYVKEQEAKFAKADFDWIRYLVEEHRTKVGDPAADQQKLDTALETVNITSFRKEQSEGIVRAAQAKVDQLTAGVTDAEKALTTGTRELDRLRKRLETLQPSDKAVVVANVIRDAPGLDFVGPSLRVEKTVLDNLTFELNFTKTKRVDMCQTCHAAIDRPEFGEGADKEPLRAHPRLDLYVSTKSPHPMKDVGCTICHRGAGEALDFVRADHRPSDEHEEERWAKDHHWHKQHHWDYPMLEDSNIESSCVQCHKTSMEVIADEAPKVSEGYQLFEQYGCYSCHKVDWFPTSRKPGPSLKNLQAKLKPDFISAWVENPKAFRPTTWMPQIFHLENFAPDEVIAKSNYGDGPEIKGQQWNETAVAAVTAFLLDRAPKRELPPVPVDGDAERGREVFRVSGCLACHNMAPFDGAEPKTHDLAFEREGTNEHGPNLRGVATKLNKEWLYWWVKDPTEYWPDTRMPNLRLSDQDAADITAYLMVDPDGTFHDVPAGWTEHASKLDAETLREQARWFFSKAGRAEIGRRLAGDSPQFPWNDLDKLKVAVGEQLVMHQGCYSCHEISGMEEMMPIGTELSNWGSKTVDKLDFGFAYQIPLGGRPVLNHEYREGWLERKLHAPRSFDLQKIKNPKEKLRMPYFAFTDEQVNKISTFMLGLVDDEVQLAKMQPKPDTAAMDAGLRAIRQKNCMACHVVEPGTVTFKAEDGHQHTVVAELLALENDTMPPEMNSLEALERYLKGYEEENEEEVEEIGLRLLGPAPDFGAPGETVFVKRADLVAVKPPQGGKFVHRVTDYYFHGVQRHDAETSDPEEAIVSVTADPDGEGKVQDVDGRFRNYSEEPYDKVRWTFAPPVLVNEGHKLQREWFYEFLNDPMPLREQMRVRMPTFHYRPGEAGAIADSFAYRSRKQWPSRYARALRTALGLELAEPDGERLWPSVLAEKKGFEPMSVDALAKAAGIEPQTLAGIERGSQLDADSGIAKLQAYGETRKFHMPGPVDPAHERVTRRSPTYLASRAKHLNGSGDPVRLGESVGVKGPNCYQCHFHEGKAPDQKEAPISWAPDLGRVRERLREDWTAEWLWNPAVTYPGTSMPANFLGDPPQYQQVYPNSSNSDQVQAVLDWMFNLDRLAPISQ